MSTGLTENICSYLQQRLSDMPKEKTIAFQLNQESFHFWSLWSAYTDVGCQKKQVNDFDCVSLWFPLFSGKYIIHIKVEAYNVSFHICFWFKTLMHMGFKHSLHVNTLSEKGYCDSGIALAGHSIGMVLLKKLWQPFVSYLWVRVNYLIILLKDWTIWKYSCHVFDELLSYKCIKERKKLMNYFPTSV